MKIMEWPLQERPRERLLRDGAHSLSDAELLAIFLRTGTRQLNVVDLARHLLNDFSGLRPLLEANQATFTEYPGLGTAKYCQLQASLELSKRYLQQKLQLGQGFTNPDEVKSYLKSLLSHEKREQFVVLFLNNQHQLLSTEVLFSGTLNSAEVHPRVIAEKALHYHAAAVILAHNHPSGVLEPSESDKHITQQIVAALKLLDIRVLDHIIVAGNQCYSFAERGLL
ncbi:MAG: DNA repair protein RadC [Kangiellaceae bacterium]|nr:DNA repair protein RadC [Kangiellaceae bacterium]